MVQSGASTVSPGQADEASAFHSIIRCQLHFWASMLTSQCLSISSVPCHPWFTGSQLVATSELSCRSWTQTPWTCDLSVSSTFTLPCGSASGESAGISSPGWQAFSPHCMGGGAPVHEFCMLESHCRLSVNHPRQGKPWKESSEIHHSLEALAQSLP